MTRQTYDLEIITPCFCAGADPAQAEIRAPSIRGQLRWWFRVLGGFKSLAPKPLREQEEMIFGSAAGDEGTAGKLQVRVEPGAKTGLNASIAYPAPEMQSPHGYLLFPLRNKARSKSGVSGFKLHLLWRESEPLGDDLKALATVMGNFGSLGFRSRRAMGALSLTGQAGMTLRDALDRFSSTGRAIAVRKLPGPNNGEQASISKLAEWLRGWRQHGRSQDLRPGNRDKRPPENDGFDYAKRDHDIGYNLTQQPAFRPALGLPIIQRAGGKTNNWDYDGGQHKGRFASPVILRPHRDSTGSWSALVIFVEALSWPAGHQAYLNGKPRAVSLDLYNAMKADPSLHPFP